MIEREHFKRKLCQGLIKTGSYASRILLLKNIMKMTVIKEMIFTGKKIVVGKKLAHQNIMADKDPQKHAERPLGPFLTYHEHKIELS